MERMADAMVVQWISEKYEALRGTFNERTRRLWAAAEARSLGHGGPAAVIAATGMSSATLYKGLAELAEAQRGGDVLSPKRIRQPGAGRRRATEKQPRLARALQRLVEPTARGDAGCGLRWTCKSTRKLAEELRRQGFEVGPRTVAQELKAQGFSLQSNRKTRERASHPDRDAQCVYINE